jgi:predicted site-specific integrase-resolvase
MLSRTPELLQAYQAAQLFGISLGTLNYWSRRGIGPPTVERNSSHWYARDAIQAWLKTGGASLLVRSSRAASRR